MQVGAGFLIFPDKRFQIISEYSSTIYVGGGIQNTTFGPRDPVDNVTGFRLYAWKWAAMTLGYRYSLDLTNHRDRNGFVIQVGAAHWPGRPLPPDTVTASCAVDKSAVTQDSGGYVSCHGACERCERSSFNLYVDGLRGGYQRRGTVCAVGFHGRKCRDLYSYSAS